MTPGASDPRRVPGLWGLTLGAVGVVYGDIGTSPLYAFREALLAATGGDVAGPFARQTVIGVVSLILWTLILIVALKYVLVLLHADNRGEGGPLSLMALAQRALGRAPPWLVLLGTAGTALFYGDAIITPAISVLSAVEGLKLVTPAFDPYVVPLTAAILTGLFLVQYKGTAKVAAWFGPITVVWFLAMAAAGLHHLSKDLGVLAAFNPVHAVGFVASHGAIGLATLGAVFLAVTGAEALYADLGHFGRKPIQAAWFGLVFPALGLNYLGQGALVLADPSAAANPFFRLVPSGLLLPLVVLATLATIIASQAVITGAFSLTQQAVQLGLLPRLEIRDTSAEQQGQIYVPRVNAWLLAGVLGLVFAFRSSSGLASAYGLAVTGTMVVTAVMAFIVVWRAWGQPLWVAALLIAPFLLLDLAFFAANALKVLEGGWVPLVLAAILMTLMGVWRGGSRYLLERTRRKEVSLEAFVQALRTNPRERVPGTAVFLTSDPASAPPALRHSLEHYHVLHEANIVLSVQTADTPRVSPDSEERVRTESLGDGFWRVILTFGYMERPNLPRSLSPVLRQEGLRDEAGQVSYFLSRRNLKRSPRSGLPWWQDRLYIALARSADDASDYLGIPTHRVVEIGKPVLV